ncbi:MAG TPA: zeta toxin family protein [Thermoanaerobaculia bacterium]|nr:zeta toxin family protein [Thermoanaerobaculia bacterium]
MTHPFDARPLVVALAGPNGAGKSTFYRAHLAEAGLRFVNADDLSRELGLGPYEAAEMAKGLRRELVEQRESFVFETVFSDPVGDKLSFLRDTAALGYVVVLCFIGLNSPGLSEERVAMRVAKGGHDVPSVKLRERYPRTLRNLAAAIPDLPHVLVYDNSDLGRPFREVARYEQGQRLFAVEPLPRWLRPVRRPRRDERSEKPGR